MEFRILGPVELWSQEQRYDLGWAKERLVMAILLMTPGRPVQVQSLISKMWDDAPPAEARSRLYIHVARLRSRLHDFDEGTRLRNLSGAYILETDAENIDYHRFLRLRAEARASAERGENDHALRLHREAAALWRGEPLAGLPGHWADNTRKNIERQLLPGTVDRIALQLAHGDHAPLIAELSELVTRYPFDEKLVELLMRALYVGGRQADALAAYRQTRTRLDDELGIEAGPSLRRLHQRILQHDPALLPEPRPLRTPGTAAPNDLPRDVPTFTGRIAELSILTSDRLLAETAVPVLAIDGMPGVGKSTLAVHLAHRLSGRYPDGRLYLDLRGHKAGHEAVDAATALDRLLRHLGVAGKEIPEELYARAALWRKEVAGRRVLIVLDDAAGHEQVGHLLPGVPGCLVVVTSRRRLAGLDGVESLSLDVLPAEDAATLFTRAAGTHRTHEAEDVAAATRLCGYLPLAIQLVGSRLRHHPAWSAADLVDRLRQDNRRLAEIRAEDREIAAAFRLSYEDLTGRQQRAFSRLGLYPGTELTAHSAAALLAWSHADAEKFLEDLVDQHLIIEPRRGRYRFHDLLRDYAISLSNEEPVTSASGATGRMPCGFTQVRSRRGGGSTTSQASHAR